MDNKKYKIVILGAGESGVGAAILAQTKGLSVYVSDRGKIKKQYKKELDKHNIPYEEAKHTLEILLNADTIIKSPGIPDNVQVIQLAKEKGIKIISEIEFAYRYLDDKSKIIAITGSNGKTTTTLLIYHIFRNAGTKVALGGNVGHSFARLVADNNDYDYYILEISSFQLDNSYDFNPDIAILLNITPDHLDRYEYDIKKYAAAKYRLIQNFSDENYFVFFKDDKLIIELNRIWAKGAGIPFSLEERLDIGGYADEEKMYINVDERYFEMELKDLSLKGKHNVSNSLAAAIAANIMKIKNETIRRSLMTFEGVEHRLEEFLTIAGIKFINDSKATNINSTRFALETVNDPVVWIAGGTDKGNDYSELYDIVKKKVKALVCLGVDNEKLKKSFEGIIPVIVETKSMKDAVTQAYNIANDGDTVLLSPACASFDLFENYEDRGRQFKKYVREL